MDGLSGDSRAGGEPPPADSVSSPSSGDESPPADSLETLPPEAIALALAWVGPRSIKRFGATCRAYRALVDWYVTRAEYGALLARSARLRLKNDLARRHVGCCKVSASDFDARAERHASRVAAALAGSGETPPRSKRELLRFLYPMALMAHEDWVLAPYAFEWCALAERRILTGDSRALPRCELLALLHEDAFARLARLAREAGWPLGATFAAAAAATCDALAVGADPLAQQNVRRLARQAAEDAALHGNHEWSVLCVAVNAVIDLHLAGGKRPSRSWQFVKNGGHLTRRLSLALGAQWLDLVGLEGGDRSPRAWLAKFECGPFEPHGDVPAEEVFLRFAERIARGDPPVVPVPNVALAVLLEIAVGRGFESDAEGEGAPLDVEDDDEGAPPGAEDEGVLSDGETGSSPAAE